MTARLEETRAAATPAPAQLFRQTRQAAWAAARAAFRPRPAAAGWLATRMDRDQVLGMLRRGPFTAGNPGTQRWRFRGAALAVTWLGDQPGSTWQQRWLASGAETAGADWKREGARWLDDHGVHVLKRLDLLSVGLVLAASADIIRPSLSWLAVSGISPWGLARTLEAGRDPAGFARLRAAVGEAGQITAGAREATIGRAAVLIAAKGGMLADVTAGDFLELLDAEQQGHGRRRDYSAVSWRLLRQGGAFGPHAPASLAQLLTIGQRSPAELIDRYQLSCRPVRDLLVGYLQERQPALDHTSLDALAQQLGRNFWADLEHHHPGISSLHLPPGAATAWKQRLRTKNTAPQRGGPAAQAPRLTCRAHPDRGPRLLPGPGLLGDRGPGPVGAVGRAQPGQQGRYQHPQGRAAAQIADGRAHPRAAARAAGPGPLRRRAPRPDRRGTDGRLPHPARRHVHRRRAGLHPARGPQAGHPDLGPGR